MRFSEDCPSAPTLPTMIVIVASIASAGPQLDLRVDQRDVEEAQKTPSAATLVATAMNAVIGVGAPS